MQSIFRLPTLPWPQSGAPFSAHSVDVPSAGNAIKGKRKRALDSSPRGSPSPMPKKSKAVTENGGAVQMAPDHKSKGPDGNLMHKSATIIAPKPAHHSFKSTGGKHQEKSLGMGYMTSVWRPTEPAMFPMYGNLPTAPAASCDPLAPFEKTTLLQELQAQQSKLASFQPARSEDPKPEVATTFDSTLPPVTADASRGSSSTSVFSQIPVLQDDILLPIVQSSEVPSTTVQAETKMQASTDHVRAIVETEICQAILFKHNELRLIDQEIAKCQVALEQIRRSEMIPYPSLQGFSADVASHSNPALVAPTGYFAPQHPAPWGVTDGPYTRNMARWLIQSPLFDPHLLEAVTPGLSPYVRDGRASRDTGVENTPVSAYPSARTSRTSVGRSRHGADVQSPAPQRDPLIIKRIADNQWVKLYCSECKPERSNFANVQGFLNHCRISHKLDYKSHEQAAVACGRVVSAADSFAIADPAPFRETPAKASFVSAIEPVKVGSPGVHSLVKGLNQSGKPLQTVQQIVPRSWCVADRMATGVSTPTTPTTPLAFNPSSDTPFLNTFLTKGRVGVDLSAIVADSKRKVDLSCYNESESESEPSDAKKVKVGKKKGAGAGRPIGSKPGRAGRARPKPLAQATMKPVSGMASMLPLLPMLDSPSSTSSSLPTPAESVDIEMGLSPHAMDSNPGLVSDRDEDDEEMDYEEINSSRVMADEVLIKIQDSDGEPTQVEESQAFCASRTGSC